MEHTHTRVTAASRFYLSIFETPFWTEDTERTKRRRTSETSERSTKICFSDAIRKQHPAQITFPLAVELMSHKIRIRAFTVHLTEAVRPSAPHWLCR